MVQFFDLFDVEFTLAGYSLEGVTLANVVRADFEETIGCDRKAVVASGLRGRNWETIGEVGGKACELDLCGLQS